MTSRAAFLSVVRERLGRTAFQGDIRPIIPTPNGPIRYAIDLSDLEESFLEAAARAGAEPVGGPEADLSSIIGRIIDELAPVRAVVSEDPECDGIAAMLASAGVEMLETNDPAILATADLGVTGAIAGIALTGTLVVSSGGARTRLASLLPEVHLALVRADLIVETPGDLLRDLSSRFPEGLPSNLVLVTGPSRSADIELVITIGVHGPRRVLIALR